MRLKAILALAIVFLFAAATADRSEADIQPLSNGKLLAVPAYGSIGVGSLPMNAISVRGG